MAIVPLEFSAADIAASTGGAALPVGALPDVADVTGYQFPFPVKIIGITLNGAPASGDTVAVQANLAAAGMAGPAVTITNAIPVNAWFGGDADGVLVPANTNIQLFYKTTTGGTYTVKDLLGRIYVRMPASPSLEYGL